MQIKIVINEDTCLQGFLYENKTAQKISAALPIRGQGKTWGEEIYFVSKVKAPLENPKEVLQAGEIAYWPPLQAICIFFGPTPASQGDEIRAAGPVNVIGRVEGDLDALRSLKEPLQVTLIKD